MAAKMGAPLAVLLPSALLFVALCSAKREDFRVRDDLPKREDSRGSDDSPGLDDSRGRHASRKRDDSRGRYDSRERDDSRRRDDSPRAAPTPAPSSGPPSQPPSATPTSSPPSVSPTSAPSQPPSTNLAPAFSVFDDSRLRACSNLLSSIDRRGRTGRNRCCDLFERLSNVQAASCLCFAARNSLFGLNLRVPQDVALVLTFCGRPAPPGFTCP